MLKRMGITLSLLLFVGVIMSCEKQDSPTPTQVQEEVGTGNLENDMIIKVDQKNVEVVFITGEELENLESSFDSDEEVEEVYYSQKNGVIQRCLKHEDQLLLIEKSDYESVAKLKEILDNVDQEELWEVCEKELESFALKE